MGLFSAAKAGAEWLFSEKSLGSATWGLVIATFMLYLDSRQKSKDQNRQWKNEQEQREEDATPSAVVEIAATRRNPRDMYFLVFNLGSNSFYIDRMSVTAADGMRAQSDVEPVVVMPGTFVSIWFDPGELLRLEGEPAPFKNAHVVFSLRGAKRRFNTDREFFNVGSGFGNAASPNPVIWRIGVTDDYRPGTMPAGPKMTNLPTHFVPPN